MTTVMNFSEQYSVGNIDDLPKLIAEQEELLGKFIESKRKVDEFKNSNLVAFLTGSFGMPLFVYPLVRIAAIVRGVVVPFSWDILIGLIIFILGFIWYFTVYRRLNKLETKSYYRETDLINWEKENKGLAVFLRSRTIRKNYGNDLFDHLYKDTQKRLLQAAISFSKKSSDYSNLCVYLLKHPIVPDIYVNDNVYLPQNILFKNDNKGFIIGINRYTANKDMTDELIVFPFNPKASTLSTEPIHNSIY